MKLKKIFYCWFFLALISISSMVQAAPVITIEEIMKNLRAIVNPIVILLLVISFLGGVTMIWRGITLLKLFGLPPGHMFQRGELAAPMVNFVVGSILIYLPSSANILQTTFFGPAEEGAFNSGRIDLQNIGTASEELLAYSTISFSAQWLSIANTIVLFIQLVGVISFVRGWFIIGKMGHQGGSGQPIFSKGVTHIIGGIIAINFKPFIDVVRNTVLGL